MVGNPPPSKPSFSRYIIETRLACGSMGEVFRALALGSNGIQRQVVIKRILPVHAGRSDLAELFVDEARVMKRLVHPNLVQVLDFGIGENGDYYLVQELVEGLDLRRLCKWHIAHGEALPIPLSLLIAKQMLHGLAYAHQRSAEEGQLIVHRDVSPGNVLLSTQGEVKVTDFGIAIATCDSDDQTASRELVGKPHYMAPEQFDGEKVDPRADIFSVGVVLFEMLAGVRPFAGTNALACMHAAKEGRFSRASELRPQVTEAIEAILSHALAPKKDDRYPDATAMINAIDALRDEDQAIASSDDLAEVVAITMLNTPESKPSQRPVQEVPPEENLEGRVLSRTNVVESFTLRISEQQASSDGDVAGATDDLDRRAHAEEAEPSSSPNSSARQTFSSSDDLEREAKSNDAPHTTSARSHAPQSLQARRSRAGLLVVGLIVLVVAVVALNGNGPKPVDRAKSISAQIHAGALPVVMNSPPKNNAPLAYGPQESPTQSPTAAVRPTPARAASAPVCQGVVQLLAKDGWVVAGGPEAVEAPGVYSWPCGTFELTATNSKDKGNVTHKSVVVKPAGTTVVDLSTPTAMK